MADLDFSALGDDQLTELLRAGLQEAFRRSPACVAAVQGAYLSEAERALIAREATIREAARLRQEEVRRCEAEAAEKVRHQADQRLSEERSDKERRFWAMKKGFAEALASVGWDVRGDQLVVWVKDGRKERRVFLQELGYGGVTYATLYVTGNDRFPPGTVEFAKRVSKAHQVSIPPILHAAARDWSMAKIDLETALKWSGVAIPVNGIPSPEPKEPSAPATVGQKLDPPSQVVPPTLRREQRGEHGGWYWACNSCNAWEHETDSTRIRHTSRCENKEAQPPERIAA